MRANTNNKNEPKKTITTVFSGTNVSRKSSNSGGCSGDDHTCHADYKILNLTRLNWCFLEISTATIQPFAKSRNPRMAVVEHSTWMNMEHVSCHFDGWMAFYSAVSGFSNHVVRTPFGTNLSGWHNNITTITSSLK